ncbi:histidine kinase [Aureimonas ureilytica]|uniref:histidine kinase n=1 Tax=Aureimonas ureilytica TaxID=401562 RepID=A0A175RQJ2_9HYPH|nr:HAMP domain-containing sensor histidine kinase [Aureimonas ureilytica]KTR06000.1 histidine kinase [Aureimonas ureilytica]
MRERARERGSGFSVLRTTTYRLALAYTLIFILAVAAIMGLTYAVATHEIRGISVREIDHDMAVFESAFREGGEAELRHSVHERSEGAPGDSFFLLLAPDGSFLEGNIPPVLWREGWNQQLVNEEVLHLSQDLMDAAATNSDDEVRLFSFGREIGPYRLLAGRNSHVLHEIQEIMLACLLLGCVAISLVAMVSAYVFSREPARRLNEIAEVTHKVVAGRFELRLPVTKRGDEIDRLSGDVNRMLSRIETLMESLRQVSTDIAHDLRTPLARLRQRLDTMARQRPEPARFERAMEEAIEESDTIIETFNALLRIAQVEAGARRARFRPLDLSKLVDNVCDTYGEVALDEGHRLDPRIEPGLTIQGDGELLTQLLANLIENAIRHVPAPAKIEVRLGAQGGAVILSVRDDGPGVPAEEREAIFRRLYRLDRSRTTPGTGLGLAMVSAIADLHEARIDVSDGEPGLCVALLFPPLTELGALPRDGA